MEANKKGIKGVWLCAAIYEASELSAVEKLLLAEIDALTTNTDACYATNAHFSERLGVTVTRVDHLLGKLARLGYIVRVSFDGRVTRRVLAPEYSSNPGHSIALIGTGKRQSRSVKNDRAALSQITEQHCRKEQGSTAKNSRAPYIEKIPNETPTSETTTTINLDNKKKGNEEEPEESSSRRFFEGENSFGSLRDRAVGAAGENTSAFVDRLPLEYGLSRKQRQTISEYCDLKSEEYVRSKLEIIRAQSCRNAGGALVAALEDDWQPPVSTKGEKNATREKPVRSGNRNIGNSNEHCDKWTVITCNFSRVEIAEHIDVRIAFATRSRKERYR